MFIRSGFNLMQRWWPQVDDWNGEQPSSRAWWIQSWYWLWSQHGRQCWLNQAIWSIEKSDGKKVFFWRSWLVWARKKLLPFPTMLRKLDKSWWKKSITIICCILQVVSVWKTTISSHKISRGSRLLCAKIKPLYFSRSPPATQWAFWASSSSLSIPSVRSTFE